MPKFEVTLYGTWNREWTDMHEVNMFQNGFKRHEFDYEGDSYTPALKQSFDVLTLTGNTVPHSGDRAWGQGYTDAEGEFLVRFDDVTARTESAAINKAFRELEWFLGEIACTPPELTLIRR
jgi:hypothetical protein